MIAITRNRKTNMKDWTFEEELRAFKLSEIERKETKRLAKIEAKESQARRVKEAEEEFEEIHAWISDARKFYESKGLRSPEFKMSGNFEFNVNSK